MRTLLRLAGCTLMLAVLVVSSLSGTSPLPLTPFRLGPATTYPAPDTSLDDVALGDLNGDGRPDMVMAGYFDDLIVVRLNQGLGVFGPSASYPVASLPRDIELADVNGDGRLDVVVAPAGGVTIAFRQTQPGIAVLLANADGTLQPQIFSPLAAPRVGTLTGPTTVAVGDMNGDGHLDAVVNRLVGFAGGTSGDALNDFEVALGDGAGAFTVASRTAAEWALEVHSGDFDRDGKLDILALFDGSVRLYRGNGSGDLLPGTAIYVRPGTRFESGDVGDLNGDGALDVALTTDPGTPGDPETLVALLGRGDGTFKAPIVTTLTGERSVSSRIADMDRDGIADVVHEDDLDAGPRRLQVSLGRGDGTFKPVYAYALPYWPRKLDVADVDGNGLPDVVVTVFDAGVAVVLDGSDRTAPVLTVPSTLIAEADRRSGAIVSYSVSATDDVDGPIPPSCSPVSGALFAFGDTTVSCTVADAWGNQASGTFHVIVRDTTGPVLTVPSGVTAEAAGPAGAVVTFAATATDVVDGAIAPLCTPGSGATFALGDTTVSCHAVDRAGNRSDDVFHVTVRDTTRPILTVPAGITREAGGPAGAVITFAATATDVVDGAVTPVCTPVSGGVFPIGDTPVSCRAVDAAGNQSDSVFHVIVRDTTAPKLAVPDDITANATIGITHPTHAIVTFSASASDLVDGVVVPVCAPASGSLFALGTTTVTCTATDARGNASAPKTFTVTVQVPPPFDPFAQLIAASTGVGPGKSLLNKALEARAAYQAFNSAGACSVLTGYLNEVRAQSGKKLTAAQAAMLTDLAQTVRAFLGC